MEEKILEIKAEEIGVIFSRCVAYIRLMALAFSFLIGMFICGALVLVCRFLDAPGFVYFLLVGVSVCLSFAVALSVSRRSRLSMDSVAALADRESGAGGLLMEVVEGKSFSGWERNLECIRVPTCDIPWRKPFGLFLAGLVFITACALIPIPDSADIYPPPGLDISRPLAGLKAKLEVLEDVGAMDTGRKSSIEEAMAVLEKNRSALEPGKIYESLDAMESSLQSLGASSAEQNIKTAGMIRKFDAMSRSLAAAPDEDAERRLRDFASKFSEALQDLPALPAGQLQQILQGMPFDPVNNRFAPGMMEKWQAAMKLCLADIGQNIEKLRKCGFCHMGAEELKALLGDVDGDEGDLLVSLLMSCEGGGKPGSGGITRGPGPAPLLFGAESPELPDGDTRKLDSQLAAPDLQETVGVSFHAPGEEAVDDGGDWRALTSEQGSGGDARRHRISPHDREMIKKYFSKN